MHARTHRSALVPNHIPPPTYTYTHVQTFRQPSASAASAPRLRAGNSSSKTGGARCGGRVTAWGRWRGAKPAGWGRWAKGCGGTLSRYVGMCGCVMVCACVYISCIHLFRSRHILILTLFLLPLCAHPCEQQQAKEAVQQRMWTRVLEHFVVLPIEADLPCQVN